MRCATNATPVLAFVFTLACAASDNSNAAAGAPADRVAEEAAITAQVELYETALNQHDASAVSGMYTQDGDLIVYDGPRLRGRDAVKASMDSVPRTLQIEIAVTEIRFVSPDIALVETTAKFNEGEIRENRGSSVLVRENGKWLQASLRVFAAERK